MTSALRATWKYRIMCVCVFCKCHGMDAMVPWYLNYLQFVELKLRCMNALIQIMESERQELKQDSDVVRRIVQDWCFFLISSREVLWNSGVCELDMLDVWIRSWKLKLSNRNGEIRYLELMVGNWSSIPTNCNSILWFLTPSSHWEFVCLNLVRRLS